MTPEVIEQMCKSYKGNNLDNALKDALAVHIDVKSRVESIRLRLTRLEEDFKRKKQECIDQLNKEQARCKHYDNEYFPDASGNNDSESYCNTCGQTTHGRFPTVVLEDSKPTPNKKTKR